MPPRILDGMPFGQLALCVKDRVTEINFGADSPDAKYRNMRAYMWGRMKE